ncbi:Phox homologous domain-containing protein [Limtongia smithiae]|uniref:Phox homologous domain-containing protein n=1 Tax=Limtongia smithiae TaxID=1125753 RepID=UPI0034CE4251
MDVMALPSTTVDLDKSVAETTASKLRDMFTFNRTNSTQVLENIKNVFTPNGKSSSSVSKALALAPAPMDSSVSSVLSSDSEDGRSLPSPVLTSSVPGLPGDPHDLTSVDPIPITMVDNSNDVSEADLWARSTWVGDYAIVEGNGKPGSGSYVTWHCIIDTVDGKSIRFRKRYSDFVTLQHALMDKFPTLKAAIPSLPPKSIILNFKPAFLEERRRGLEYFLACVILNPEFANSDVVKRFISSTESTGEEMDGEQEDENTAPSSTTQASNVFNHDNSKLGI